MRSLLARLVALFRRGPAPPAPSPWSLWNGVPTRALTPDDVREQPAQARRWLDRSDPERERARGYTLPARDEGRRSRPNGGWR